MRSRRVSAMPPFPRRSCHPYTDTREQKLVDFFSLSSEHRRIRRYRKIFILFLNVSKRVFLNTYILNSSRYSIIDIWRTFFSLEFFCFSSIRIAIANSIMASLISFSKFIVYSIKFSSEIR